MKPEGSIADFKIIKKNKTFFHQLDDTQLFFLLSLMEKIVFPPGEVIVKEGDLGGDIFFVASGHLQVTCKSQKNILGKLNQGDVIGVAGDDFYSQTGLRTATVTTSSESILFLLKLESLIKFLEKYPRIDGDVHRTADRMMQAKFIKESAQLSDLSPAAINELSKALKIELIKANTTIFREGEFGQKCYLIRSGKLAVSAAHDGEEERIISTLTAPMLFGETSLLTESPRNATVRTLTDCELFSLDHETFLKIVEKESKFMGHLSTLLIERSRPLKNPDVEIYFQKKADGEMIGVLKNKVTAVYYRLSRVGIHVWQLIDGKTTPQEMMTSVFENYFIFSPESIIQLIGDLEVQGFVLIPAKSDLKLVIDEAQMSWLKRIALRITKIMEYEYSFKAVDKLVTSIYQKGGKYLFSWIAQFVFLSVILIGGILFFELTPKALLAIKSSHLILIVIAVTILNFLTVFTHELSHALTTKHFGHQVHRFGVGWYWVSGIAFTDTSDMWLSTRWPRTLVNVAGLYSDLVFAGLAMIAALFVSSPSLLLLLWLFALSSYLIVFKNLDPTLEYDGYYILMDVTDKPSLRESAVVWLINLFSRKNFKGHILYDHKMEFMYWICCIIFFAISIQLAIFLQSHIVQQFFPSIVHSTWYDHFVTWGIPIIVVVLASFGIWAEVAKRSVSKALR